MNIKDATPEQKLRALAELDGWLDVMEYTFDYDWMGEKGKHKQWLGRSTDCLQDLKPLKSYLTSYDAIIPLIQKLDEDTRANLLSWLTSIMKDDVMANYLMATPSQLCDAILIATGKFEA